MVTRPGLWTMCMASRSAPHAGNVDGLRHVGLGVADLNIDLVSVRMGPGRLRGTIIDRWRLRHHERLDLHVAERRLHLRKTGMLRARGIDALLDRSEPGMLQPRHRHETDREGKRGFYNDAHGSPPNAGRLTRAC